MIFTFLRSLLKICLFPFITTYVFLMSEVVFEHWVYQTTVLLDLEKKSNKIVHLQNSNFIVMLHLCFILK